MTDKDHKMAIHLALETLCSRLNDARRDGLEFKWRLNDSCLEGTVGPYWRLEGLRGSRTEII